MLHLVRNNNPFTVLILFIFALLAKLPALLHPIAPVLPPNVPAYHLVLHACGFLVGHSAFGFSLLAVVLIFLQGLYLNGIANRHKLFPRSSYAPAFFYILFTSLFPAFNHFNNIIFVNWFLLAALDVMLSFTQPLNPRKHIFNAAFMVVMSSMFQFSALALLLLLIMAMILLRPFNVGEWVVAIIGAVTVVYFFAGILYLTDRIELFRGWIDIGLSIPRHLAFPIYLAGLTGGLIILTACGFIAAQMQMAKSTIYVRRSWGVIAACFIAGIFGSIFVPAAVGAAWLMPLPALSLIASQPLNLEKSKRFSNFIFYFSLLLLVFCQVAAHK